jgi:hypothetical protein
MPLNDRQVKAAKPRDKDYKLADEKGLYLLVKVNGSRYWRLKYRFNGKEKTLSIGVYPDVSTGDGALGTVTSTAGVQAGDYVLTITAAQADAGVFQLVDPQGDVAGVGTVGTAFTGGGLSFTLADGATDFAVGDSFTITVESSGLLAEWNPANTDGTDTVAGILFAGVDATSGNKRGVLVARKAVVTGGDLTYFDGATDADKAAAEEQLNKLGISVG